MRSICLYSSYFDQPGIPYYVRFYLENIIPYFSETIFITNEKELDEDSRYFLNVNNISLLKVDNEGWDFGMWYKALAQMDTSQYQQIALVNDSCILFKQPTQFFEWLRRSDADVCSVTDSNAIGYHLQSYFLVFNQKAIPQMVNYFKEHKLLKDVGDVIETYEVGLSKELLNKGLKLDACYSSKDYHGEFSPTFYLAERLLRSGMPMIKKKIVFASYRKPELFTLARMNFNINAGHYVDLIKQITKEPIIDFEKVKKDQATGMNMLDRLIYNAKRNFILTYRKLKGKRHD
ncbi:MAG: rhamnan synthesis F family protein [Bacteroidota bacterium]